MGYINFHLVIGNKQEQVFLIGLSRCGFWGCLYSQIWTDKDRGTTKGSVFWLSIGNRLGNLFIPESWESSCLIISEGLTTR